MQLVDDVIILQLAGNRVRVGATGLRQHTGGGVDEQLREPRVPEVDEGVGDVREHACGFAHSVSCEKYSSAENSSDFAALNPVRYAGRAGSCTIYNTGDTEFGESRAGHQSSVRSQRGRNLQSRICKSRDYRRIARIDRSGRCSRCGRCGRCGRCSCISLLNYADAVPRY